jgi:rRNA maturation endonuclease Nob1
MATEEPIKSVTEAEFEQLKKAGAGICIGCGNVQPDGVQPDAEKDECAVCGATSVCGVELAVINNQLGVTERMQDPD